MAVVTNNKATEPEASRRLDSFWDALGRLPNLIHPKTSLSWNIVLFYIVSNTTIFKYTTGDKSTCKVATDMERS